MLFANRFVFLLVFLSLFISSCAIYYRDSATNAEHIWGFGHLAIKPPLPAAEKQAVVTRVGLFGAAVGVEEGSFGFSLGFNQREKIMIYDPNSILSIKRPFNDDSFLFRFGSWPDEPPTSNDSKNNKGN
jgi:hypothetical protein